MFYIRQNLDAGVKMKKNKTIYLDTDKALIDTYILYVYVSKWFSNDSLFDSLKILIHSEHVDQSSCYSPGTNFKQIIYCKWKNLLKWCGVKKINIIYLVTILMKVLGFCY